MRNSTLKVLSFITRYFGDICEIIISLFLPSSQFLNPEWTLPASRRIGRSTGKDPNHNAKGSVMKDDSTFS